MKLDKAKLSLLDGISTEEFGYVRFLKVQDLVEYGENEYNNCLIPYVQNVKIYDLPNEFKNLDLLFFKFDGAKRMMVSEDKTVLDYLVKSISMIYSISEEKIDVDLESHSLSFMDNNGKAIKIHRFNFDDFADIVLANTMISRSEKEKEVKFKTDLEDDRKKQFLEWLEYEEKRERENASSILTIANIVMSRLKLYAQKDVIRNMTIYNLLFAYTSEFSIEGYENTYKQYLAGGDPKKLDMVHWSDKIKNTINKED